MFLIIIVINAIKESKKATDLESAMLSVTFFHAASLNKEEDRSTDNSNGTNIVATTLDNNNDARNNILGWNIIVVKYTLNNIK